MPLLQLYKTWGLKIRAPGGTRYKQTFMEVELKLQYRKCTNIQVCNFGRGLKCGPKWTVPADQPWCLCPPHKSRYSAPPTTLCTMYTLTDQDQAEGRLVECSDKALCTSNMKALKLALNGRCAVYAHFAVSYLIISAILMCNQTLNREVYVCPCMCDREDTHVTSLYYMLVQWMWKRDHSCTFPWSLAAAKIISLLQNCLYKDKDTPTSITSAITICNYALRCTTLQENSSVGAFFYHSFHICTQHVIVRMVQWTTHESNLAKDMSSCARCTQVTIH